MVLCYKITHKYKELLPFLLYLMIASIYYENYNYTGSVNAKIRNDKVLNYDMNVFD